MNILHIISSAASGGAEVYVKDLAKYLSKQGHVLHIAFLSTAADAGRDLEYEKAFLNELSLSGVKTYFIGNETRNKPWLGIARVKKYIKENNIDVCHTHLAYGIVFSVLSRIPVVYTHHTIEPRWGKLTYTVFNRLVDRYVGISKECASALEKYSGRNVYTIPNAVSESRFFGYTRKRKLKDTVNIVMVGRICIQKDYINMLKAIKYLDSTVKEKINIFIAGEGDDSYKKELHDYIKNNDINIVEFVGVKKNIPDFLYGADVFIMSSAWEGLPIALIEATVSGLPCIVTDVGGCSEVIRTCENGIVVRPKEPKELASAITRMVLDKEYIEILSINAINNSHNYLIDAAAERHIELYESIVE